MQSIRLGSQARPFPALRLHPPLQFSRSSAFRLPTRSKRLNYTTTARSEPNKERIAKPSSAWRSFWATIDAGAWLGTVGSAVAFLLTQEAILVGGPILLPIIALYASKQRGRLDSQAAQAELQSQVAAALRQVAVLSEESAAEVAEEVAALVDEVRQGRSSPEKAVRTVEAKLSSVEGTVRSVEEATKEALADAAAERSKAVKEISSALVSLRRDVNADLRQATGDELAALGKVDGRLAALEGAISGLEVAQSEGLRRLGSSMSGALLESKDLLAAAVRDEVWQSLEPVRQLPQALAAAAPGLAAAAEQSGQSIDEESLRALVSQEIAAAGQELLEKQRELLKEAMVTPTTIAPAQWNQLGKKLVALDDQLTDLKTEQESQIQSLLGEGSTAAQQVAALRSELVELSLSVKSALEQQQVAQKAALALPTQPGGAAAAVAEELFLGPLEASLLQLQNELRSAAEVAAVDRQAADSQWLVDLEIRLVKLVNPVLQAIAASREAAAAAFSSSSSSAAAVAGESTFEQATAGITSMSEKLEALGDQLAALEGRIILNTSTTSNNSEVSSRQPLQETMSQQIGKSSSSSSSVIGVIKGGDEDGIAKKEAYQRMQALLRGGDDGNLNSSVDATSAVEAEEEEEVTNNNPAAATGVPISDWLSLDDEEDTEVRTPTTAAAASAVEKEEAASVVGIGVGVGNVNSSVTATTNNNNNAVGAGVGGGSSMSSGRNSTPSFIQEQIAFEAALAAGEDEDDEDRTNLNEEERKNSTNNGTNGATANTSSSSASGLPSSTSSIDNTEEPAQNKQEVVAEKEVVEEKDEFASTEQEQQPTVDLQALYTQGLELLRQGRAYAAVAAAASNSTTTLSSVPPGQRDALNAADAALTEAARCFQAASSIPDDSLTVIKAIGNSGNALMARARVKRELARIIQQEQEEQNQNQLGEAGAGKIGDMAERSLQLESEAKELLVLAGRRYREVLVNDPSQGRAFLNWGRAVCLRAEMAKESADFSSAFSLFSNAAEKFQAALQLDAEPAEGLKLAGTALASAATCIGIGDGSGDDDVEEEEKRVLLEEAEGYLVASLEAGAGDDAELQLEECRRLLDA